MKVEEILQEAIQGEVGSYEIYSMAENMVQTEHVKALLRELAQEELGHKAALEKLLANRETARAEDVMRHAVTVAQTYFDQVYRG